MLTRFFHALSAFGFHQFIDAAARDFMILDWVLTNVPSPVLSHAVPDPIDNLDHNPIFIKLHFSHKYRIVSEPFFMWNYKYGGFHV